MAGKRRGKHDIAPVIRASFIEGLRKVQQRTGKTFSDIMADLIEEDPIEVLKAVSKFTVREKTVDVSGKVDHEHKHLLVSETEKWLDSWIEGDAKVIEPPKTKQ